MAITIRAFEPQADHDGGGAVRAGKRILNGAQIISERDPPLLQAALGPCPQLAVADMRAMRWTAVFDPIWT